MHYRRIDPQPNPLTVVTDTWTEEQWKHQKVARPNDMPTATICKVAGEWFWRQKTARETK